MLQTLTIRDFVIVNVLNLEFERGFTVLTGETGAGKSILIDALSLALGARAETGVTRAGCDKAEISATFNIAQNTEANGWLKTNEIDIDDAQLILRRVMYADGRTRAFINGIAATVQQLKELGEFLVDIYSQNAHHALLKLSTQRAVLDEFSGLTDTAQQLVTAYQHWNTLHQQGLTIQKNAAIYADELAELRDKNRDLIQLGVDTPNWQEDWDALQQEHSRLSNGASLLSGTQAILELLSEGELSAIRLLSQVQHKLQDLREFDHSLDEAVESLDSVLISVEEIDRFLNRYVQRTELDPQRLNEVELRIQANYQAARKYRVRPEELPSLLDTGQQRMAELEAFTNDGALAKQAVIALDECNRLAKKLSAGRALAANTLSEKITAEMQRLSLSGGQFVVQLSPQALAANGLEQVEFLVAGHAGVAPKPLSKVASGGELSRISLAIRVVTAQQHSVATMIFDEVDVGIGGGVAEVVGQLLKTLAQESPALAKQPDKQVDKQPNAQLQFNQRQVLVITHLPQVASQGAQHLRVSKSQLDNQTLSTIVALNQSQRIDEIARMLGGIEITDTTRQHASEMLGF